MAIVSAADLEGRFSENDAPTSADFAAVFDSFLHKVSAAGTALAVRSLGAGAVGSALFSTATTAAAQQQLGGGVAGRTVFEAVATASAINNLGLIATTAQMSAPTNTSSAFTTPGLQHYHPLHPKAWVCFNGAGTVSIREAWNVASLGDLGTGFYRVTWGSAFGNALYGLGGMGASNVNGLGTIVSEIVASAGDRATGDAKVITSIVSLAATLTDSSVISVWAISR